MHKINFFETENYVLHTIRGASMFADQRDKLLIRNPLANMQILWPSIISLTQWILPVWIPFLVKGSLSYILPSTCISPFSNRASSPLWRCFRGVPTCRIGQHWRLHLYPSIKTYTWYLEGEQCGVSNFSLNFHHKQTTVWHVYVIRSKRTLFILFPLPVFWCC